MKTKRPKPTQDEVMAWLKDNHPALYILATRERDWVWIRQHQTFAAMGMEGPHKDSLRAYGFRVKREGVHTLPDKTEACWYHTCQGKWFPYSKKRRGKSQLNHSKFMSKADALEIATNL